MSKQNEASNALLNEAKQNNPRHLRSRIAELEAENKRFQLREKRHNLTINLKIAEIENLRDQFCYLKADYQTGTLYACDVIGDTPAEKCVIVDYITDDNLTVPLYKKLLVKGYHLSNILNDHSGVPILTTNVLDDLLAQDYTWNYILNQHYPGHIRYLEKDDIHRAICLAYIAEFGNE